MTKQPTTPPTAAPVPGPRIGPRPFGVVLAEIADGDLERRLMSEFAQLTRAVQETGKPGKLVISLLVGTDGKMVRVVADTKVTVPKPSIEGTAFFADDRGGLHVENPRQTKLWPSGAARDGDKVDLGERKPAWPYNGSTTDDENEV